MKEDGVTNTEADAGKYELLFGDADLYDDRPTKNELLADLARLADESDW